MRKDEEEGDVDDSTADDDEDRNNGEDDVTINELVDVVDDANAGDTMMTVDVRMEWRRHG